VRRAAGKRVEEILLEEDNSEAFGQQHDERFDHFLLLDYFISLQWNRKRAPFD